MLQLIAFFALFALRSAQAPGRLSPKAPITEIPILGLGTYLLNLSPQNASDAVAGAIELGYRAFDTAAIYNNQKLLAPGFQKGLEKTGLKREDIWVTSKLWNNRYASASINR
jgi:alcohol dehydrogenase (NADP+)